MKTLGKSFVLCVCMLLVFCICACGEAPAPDLPTDGMPTVITTEATSELIRESSTAETEGSGGAEHTPCTSITLLPEIWRMNRNGVPKREAAARLAEIMLESMRLPDGARAFTFDHWKLTGLTFDPSFDALKPDNRHGQLNAGVVAGNTYIVHLNFSFIFSGEYGELEEGKLYEFRQVEQDVPLIFLETDDEYLMWWASAYPGTNCPREVMEFIGMELSETLETEPPDTRHMNVTGVPGVYRMSKAGLSRDEGVRLLVDEMLKAMSVPGEDRTFTVLEYRDLQIRFFSSDRVFFEGDPVRAKNTWGVGIRAEFRYRGTYSPIGPNLDESKWWSGLRLGGETANLLVFLETEDEYLIWWKNAYPVNSEDPYPPEAEGLFEY